MKDELSCFESKQHIPASLTIRKVLIPANQDQDQAGKLTGWHEGVDGGYGLPNDGPKFYGLLKNRPKIYRLHSVWKSRKIKGYGIMAIFYSPNMIPR